MALTLTKVAETSSTITLGWTPPAGVDGYLFYANNQIASVATANLKDGSPRKEIKFSKTSPGPPFAVVAVLSATGQVEVGSYGDSSEPEPQPQPGDFLWDAPTLSNPTTRTLTNSSASVPSGSGQDLRIVFGEQLSKAIGEVKGYNDVVLEDFRLVGGTGGVTGHIIPRENTGTFFMKNGRIQLTDRADAIAVRWRQPKLYHVNMWIEVTDAGGSFHADAFQTQESEIDELGFDCCTIKTDYQGIFMSNEPNSRSGGRSKVTKTILSRLLFLPGTQGFPSTFFFKAFPPRPGTDPIGLTEMYDVWMPSQNAINKVYPNGYNWRGWDGSNNKYGCFLETKHHPKLNKSVSFIRFSTSSDKVPSGMPLAGQTCGDCNVRGDGGIWLYNSLSDVPDYVGSSNV